MGSLPRGVLTYIGPWPIRSRYPVGSWPILGRYPLGPWPTSEKRDWNEAGKRLFSSTERTCLVMRWWRQSNEEEVDQDHRQQASDWLISIQMFTTFIFQGPVPKRNLWNCCCNHPNRMAVPHQNLNERDSSPAKLYIALYYHQDARSCYITWKVIVTRCAFISIVLEICSFWFLLWGRGESENCLVDFLFRRSIRSGSKLPRAKSCWIKRKWGQVQSQLEAIPPEAKGRHYFARPGGNSEQTVPTFIKKEEEEEEEEEEENTGNTSDAEIRSRDPSKPESDVRSRLNETY